MKTAERDCRSERDGSFFMRGICGNGEGERLKRAGGCQNKGVVWIQWGKADGRKEYIDNQ